MDAMLLGQGSPRGSDPWGEVMPTPDEVVARAERWRPQRSLACLYLWESLAAVPVD